MIELDKQINSIKILIVDDSGFFRQQMKDTLSDLGFQDVVEAEDGMKALKKLSQDNFDVIFLDLEMPTLSGVQVLRSIRMNAATHNIPVIMVTCHSEKNNVLKAIKARVTSYILKPINRYILRSKLNEIGVA